MGAVTTRLYVVDKNGCIDTPPIFDNGEKNPPELMNIKVLGLTEFKGAQKIAAAYENANVITNAQVSLERISTAEAEAFKTAKPVR